VRLGLETGIRVQSEGIPLTWRDLDLTKGRLHIVATTAKAGKERYVPLSDAMTQRLRMMQAASTRDLVFAAKGGGLLHRFKRHFARAVRTAGLAGTGVSPHVLRHTFASRLAESSGDLLLLQQLGGWSSLALVERYAHVREGRGAEAIRRMVEQRAAGATPGVIPLESPHRRVGRGPRTS
jgi:integrase/recombinase XerC